ncbi:MAG: hypothetical protein LBC61_01065, partial [Candidatus Peribacteria bacterium]|nr:hypothetical protein [Candidatus Peribacteria bacterium]
QKSFLTQFQSLSKKPKFSFHSLASTSHNHLNASHIRSALNPSLENIHHFFFKSSTKAFLLFVFSACFCSGVSIVTLA